MGRIKPVMLRPETFITVEEAGYVLTYPRRDLESLKRRVETLKRLGVTLVEFTGPKEVLGLRVLGKGTRSVILKAWVSGRRYALKVRRLDASIPSLVMEAENMKIANRVGVGPKLLRHSEDMIVMELIEGVPIPEWIGGTAVEDKGILRNVLRKLIVDAYRLDRAGLDHGELSRASKHIYVKPDGEPVILDFGSSSTRRRPSNVTSIVQYLFIGGAVAERVRKLHGPVDRDRLLEGLRNYKRNPSRESLNNLLKTLRLAHTLPL